MATPYPIAGAAVAIAGLDKLVGVRSYEKTFAHLGWSEREMRKIGGAEVLGGLLMMLKPTRRLGAAVVLAASTTVLVSELKAGEVKLAAERAGVAAAALGALLVP